MRLVIQRVSSASVTIDGVEHSSIGQGLMILVGVERDDAEADVEWLAAKTAGLRIFNDADGIMNLSVATIGGEIMAVSQFTLTASTRKGNRPSYIRAADHALAIPLYETFCRRVGELTQCRVARGVFGADMKVALVNDGPATIIIDSHLRE